MMFISFLCRGQYQWSLDGDITLPRMDLVYEAPKVKMEAIERKFQSLLSHHLLVQVCLYFVLL